MIIKYKEYIAKITFDESYKVFRGKVTNLDKEVLSFEGSTSEELEAAFEVTVEEYIEWCNKNNTEPEKPYSGILTLQISPELHREITEQAGEKDITVHDFIEIALSHEIEREKQ